jgi:D-3-phosphoglycerate dehydrogenase
LQKLIWIIDDEWPDYEIEKRIFRETLDDYTIQYSKPHELERDLADFGRTADAVLSQINVGMTKAVIDRLEKCIVISNYGTGYNNVDVDAAAARGIKVGYIPGYCAQDIADYVLGAMLYTNFSFGCFGPAIQEGRWGAQTVSKPVHRLGAKTLFIVGMGRIGAAVAEKAAAAGVRVLAYGRSLTQERAARHHAQAVSMEEGLRSADFVSLHIKLTDETRGLFSEACFKQMKKDAYLINTSRGGVVDQKALVEAVGSRRIAGALLDVLEKEPPDANDPVLSTPGIAVTPHISYFSEEALRELQRRAAETAAKVLNGQPAADLVIQL